MCCRRRDALKPSAELPLEDPRPRDLDRGDDGEGACSAPRAVPNAVAGRCLCGGAPSAAPQRRARRRTRSLGWNGLQLLSARRGFRAGPTSYLEGTRRGSTRWIDTGWAIAAWHAGKDRVRDPITARVHRDDGTEIDATFRVERSGNTPSVVIESRGGTRGSSAGGTRGSRAERNTDYAEGLELILARLGSLGLSVAESRVESRETDQLSPDDLRLDLGAPYPIAITADDAADAPQAHERRDGARRPQARRERRRQPEQARAHRDRGNDARGAGARGGIGEGEVTPALSLLAPLSPEASQAFLRSLEVDCDESCCEQLEQPPGTPPRPHVGTSGIPRRTGNP